jgi:DNA segregation ATPase FtsK/SpoIIIE-like protein
VVNISGYNQRNRAKMDNWIVVIDELANLMLDKTLKGDAEMLLADIAAQSRAAGIHLIVATQRPDSTVMTGLIRANFPVRVAFSCSDYRSSMVILDTSDAAGLNPVGRLIYFQGASKIEMQGPLITPSMVDDKVEGIATGEAVETLERSKKHNLTPQDLFRHALNKYNGAFATRRIWEDLRAEGLGRPEVEKMGKRFENREIEIDGDVYVLLPPDNSGNTFGPRTLKRVEEARDESEESPSNSPSSYPSSTHPDGEADIADPDEKSLEIPAQSMPDPAELLETTEPTDSAKRAISHQGRVIYNTHCQS